MNNILKSNLIDLADYLENLLINHEGDVGFEMSTFGQHEPSHPCGTVACIAGHVVLRDNEDEDATSLADNVLFQPDCNIIMKLASKILGAETEIEKVKLQQLFLNYKDAWLNVAVGSYDAVLPKHAANVVRHLIDTGDVDWRVAFS